MNLGWRGRRAAGWLLAFMIVSGCGQTATIDESADPTETEVVPQPIVEFEPEPEPILPYTYPLTGMPAAEELADRPVVVMVENSPAARPQTGLFEADIVYEVLAEGDITRFVAIYHSQASEEIGPVRSIRPYMVELGRAIDGILVHAGWSPEAMNLMRKYKVAHLDQVYGDHDYYWRDSSRKAPHNLYTSMELIRKGAEAKKFREEWNAPSLAFGDVGNAGEAALHVRIPYIGSYDVGYDYDGETGTYLRSMKGEPHLDKKTDTQLSAANVLIVEARHRIVDDVGRRQIDVFGPGEGLLLQNGKMREVIWKLNDGLIRAFEEEDAEEAIPFLPGQTWIQIVPDLDKVTFEGAEETAT